MIDPENTKFAEEKALILENIDLVEEMNSFLLEDESIDRKLAEKFII